MKRYATPLLAFLVYGLWAGFANSEHGLSKSLPAGLAQGSYAFFSTLVISEVAKYLFCQFGRHIKAIIMSFLLSFIVMLAIPLIVHNIIGTPDILESILPGLAWGSLYILMILVRLYFIEKKKAKAIHSPLV